MVFKKVIPFLSCLLGFAGLSESLAASPVLEPEHSRNLRNLETAPMLFEYHRQTIGNERQYFTYPRRDTTFRKNFTKTEGNALLYFDNVRGAGVLGKGLQYKCETNDSACAAKAAAIENAIPRVAIAASLVGGIDYRGGESLGDTIWSGKDYRGGKALGDTIWPGIDGGIYLRGFIDSVDFVLDARIYNEGHSAKKPKSFDGEFLEVQKEENNSGVEYTSYARYRTHFAFNYDWLRLDFGRDVMHWGPGYYNNLTLNQFALPYNMMSLDLMIGPLRVMSFYADLRIFNNSMSMSNKDNTRNLFGHRYELAVGNATFGISELQILYDNMKPWLFVPTAPLSWMAGFQAGHDFYYKGHKIEAGTIFEYARVEPYVYSHFKKNSAQVAHLGYPLGNQGGPNSRTIDWNVFARLDGHIFASVRQTWFWKGTDYGSAVNDTTPNNHLKLPKKFLSGAKLQYMLTPAISYEGRHFSFMGELTLIDDKKAYIRAGFKW